MRFAEIYPLGQRASSNRCASGNASRRIVAICAIPANSAGGPTNHPCSIHALQEHLPVVVPLYAAVSGPGSQTNGLVQTHSHVEILQMAAVSIGNDHQIVAEVVVLPASVRPVKWHFQLCSMRRGHEAEVFVSYKSAQRWLGTIIGRPWRLSPHPRNGGILSRRRRCNTAIGVHRRRRATSPSFIVPSNRSFAGVQTIGCDRGVLFVNAATPRMLRLALTASSFRPVRAATSSSFIVPSSASSSAAHGTPAAGGLVPLALWLTVISPARRHHQPGQPRQFAALARGSGTGVARAPQAAGPATAHDQNREQSRSLRSREQGRIACWTSGVTTGLGSLGSIWSNSPVACQLAGTGIAVTEASLRSCRSSIFILRCRRHQLAARPYHQRP